MTQMNDSVTRNNEVTEAAIALVREFLNRKGCTETMKMLDNEMPRSDQSITNRAQLVQTLHVTTLMRRNKELKNPYRTMIEILAWDRIKKKFKGCVNSDTHSPSHEKNDTQNITVQNSSLHIEESTNEVSTLHNIGNHDTTDQSSDLGILRKIQPKTARPTTASNKSRVDKNQLDRDERPSTSSMRVPTVPNQSLDSQMKTNTEVEDVLLDVDSDFENQGFNWLKKEKPKNNEIPNNNQKSTTDGGITWQLATKLKKLVFGRLNHRGFNDAWRKQSFTFHECNGDRAMSLRCGIIQKQGGPCGVLAVVQSYFLKHLLFGTSKDVGTNVLNVSKTTRSSTLAYAMAEIIWQCGDQSSATVALLSQRQQFPSFTGGRDDGITEFVTFISCPTLRQVQRIVMENITSYEHGLGSCILLLYSVVMTRGINTVRSDMDEKTSSLIGSHFYCTQELVNLLISGRACSNVFNDIMMIDTNKKLTGIHQQCNIGFLTLFEHFNSCKVGEHLKTPKYPIWVVCSESHYSVFFGLNMNPLQYSCPSFDLYYYDGLANQDETICLTVMCGAKVGTQDTDLVPPLEQCIRTRWTGAEVDWNGTEPLL